MANSPPKKGIIKPVAMINHAMPENRAIAPHKRRFSNTSSHNPIAATVKANTALQLNTKTIQTQNHPIAPNLAAKTAAKIPGKARTSGWKSNKLILNTSGYKRYTAAIANACAFFNPASNDKYQVGRAPNANAKACSASNQWTSG